MSDETIAVTLAADTKSFVSGFNDAAGAVGHLGKAADGIKNVFSGAIAGEMAKARNIVIATGVALVTTGLRARSSLSAFSALQTNMQNVATVADTSVASIGKLSEGVRQLAVSGKVTQDVNQLSEGLYNIVSSGFQGADAMKVLNESAKAASAGLTDTITAGTGITQILNAYGMSANDAAKVSDTLFHTVNVGVLNFQQLAQTTGQWASVAATLKVPLGEATAALAAMTKAGSDADAAATSLRTMMLAFINPSDAMKKTLTDLGYASGTALIQQKGLAGAIQVVNEAAGGDSTKLQGLFQDVQGLNGVLQLTGPQAKFFAEQAKLMGNGMGVAGETTKALAQQQQSLSSQWAMLKNQMTEMKLELGQMLEPLAKTAVGFGSTLLGAVNSLPAPLREVAAGFSLISPALAVLAGAWGIHAVKAYLVSKAVRSVADSLKGLSLISRSSSATKAIDAVASWASKGTFKTLAEGIGAVVSRSSTLSSALLNIAADAAIAAGAIAAFAITVNTLWTNYGKADAAGKKMAETLANGAQAGDANTFKSLSADLASVQAQLEATRHDFDGLGGAAKAFYGGVQLVNPADKNTIGRDIASREELVKIGDALERAKSLALSFAKSGETVDQSWSRLSDVAKSGAIDLNQLVDAQAKVDQYASKVLKGDKLSPAQTADYQGAVAAVNAAHTAVDAYGKTVSGLSAITKTAASSQFDLVNALKAIGDSASTAKDKASAYTDVMNALMDNAHGVRDAQAGVGDALRGFLQDITDLKTAGKDLGPDLFNPFTEQGGKLQQSLSNISDGMATWAESIYRTTGNAALANGALVQVAGGFVEVAKQAGFSAEQIQTMLTIMGLTPDTISTLVQIPGADQAISILGTLTQQLDALNGSVTTAVISLQVVTEQNAQSLGLPGDPFVSDITGQKNSVTDQIKTVQDQLKQIVDQAKQTISGGVGNATKGFTPTVPKEPAAKKEKDPKEDQKLTPEEAASYAYQAGFRGADLVRIVAIMGRESGYNPKAFNPNSGTGDLSYGLTQINMIGSMGPSRRAQFGIGQNEDLFDPLTNLRSAYLMYQQSGNQLTPWGGYKGESDTYNTNMAAAQQAVSNFLNNQGNFGGGAPGSGDVQNFVDTMAGQALKTVMGGLGQASYEANQKARASVIENMAGAYSRVGQGIINESIQSGQDPSDQFNKVADAFDNLTKKVGKDTAVQLLYYARNADEYTAMADEIIHQAEIQAAKEDYLYKHGQMSAADYKAVLNQRLAATEQYSSEWVSLMDQIDQVDQDYNKAQADRDAKQRKIVEAQFAMNEMSRADYIKYLAELITHYDKYSDEYMDVWNKLHDLQQQQADAEKQLASDLKDAWTSAYNAVADPIKQATSLVAAFGNSMDVTSDSIKEFYGHMKEATTRWVTAVGQLKAAGIDQGFLNDLIHQGPQALTLAETIVGMGASGVSFINDSLGQINQMTSQFGLGQLPAASIGQYNDNKVTINVGDITVSAPGNVGISQQEAIDLVNQAFGTVVNAIQTGKKP